jgi:hypothetical protein
VSKKTMNITIKGKFNNINIYINLLKWMVYLRNKSWKPECVGSFNMDWRILAFYPEPELRDKIY